MPRQLAQKLGERKRQVQSGKKTETKLAHLRLIYLSEGPLTRATVFRLVVPQCYRVPKRWCKGKPQLGMVQSGHDNKRTNEYLDKR